jgi:cytochrome c
MRARTALMLAPFLVFAGPVYGDEPDLRDGRKAVRTCVACHHFTRDVQKFGPPLVDVIGRPVAADKTYAYSPALKALGGVWTEERLAAFLNNPNEYTPGTTMKFPGFNDMTRARNAAAFIARSQK